MPSVRKNVVFFHPDLGIGGAERLVIDAAVGLQNLGHTVTIFTSHCDSGHCFDEARDGTLDVRVRGSWPIPPTILGRFKILCSILRQLHLILFVTLNGELRRLAPTVFFVDQLSAGIPVLRWRWDEVPILFYCHFPDLLLVQGRERWWKQIWRLGFDWLEGWGIRGADKVVVNSHFTKRVVETVWKGLGEDRDIDVVYPCVKVDEEPKKKDKSTEKTIDNSNSEQLWKGKRVLLSINRFEKKKNVGLAMKAFAGMAAQERRGARLVIAGGYDLLVEENVSYHKELESLAESLELKHATTRTIVTALKVPDDIEVLFLLSVPGQMKTMLLNAASILLYTPSNEHFGIVPLEAMLAGVPVLAVNSGGPLESIVDGKTGWLRAADDINSWTQIMQRTLQSKSTSNLREMGKKGRERVKTEFSAQKMAERLDDELESLVNSPRKEVTELPDVLLAMGLLGVVAIVLYTIAYRVLRSLTMQRGSLVP